MTIESSRIKKEGCNGCLKVIVNKTIHYEIHRADNDAGFVVSGPLPGKNVFEKRNDAYNAINNHNKKIQKEMQEKQISLI